MVSDIANNDLLWNIPRKIGFVSTFRAFGSAVKCRLFNPKVSV